MNSPRQATVVRTAIYVALAVAIAGSAYAFLNYYVVRETAVVNIEALAPANAQKIREIIEAQLSPSGDLGLVRELLRAQDEQAMLLQRGWLNQAQAQASQLKAQLVFWLVVTGALLVSISALGWKKKPSKP
jgi:hypothetical protein